MQGRGRESATWQSAFFDYHRSGNVDELNGRSVQVLMEPIKKYSNVDELNGRSVQVLMAPIKKYTNVNELNGRSVQVLMEPIKKYKKGDEVNGRSVQVLIGSKNSPGHRPIGVLDPLTYLKISLF